MKYYLVFSKAADADEPIVELSQEEAYGEISSAIDAELMHTDDEDGPFDLDEALNLGIRKLEETGIFGMSKSAVVKVDSEPEPKDGLYGWDAVVLYDTEMDLSESLSSFSYEEFLDLAGLSEDDIDEDEFEEFFEEMMTSNANLSAEEFKQWFGITIDQEKYTQIQKKMAELL